MKLKELKRIIDFTLKNENAEDLEVVVLESKHSIGARASVNVEYASSGFDWESGLFIITPKIKMIKK